MIISQKDFCLHIEDKFANSTEDVSMIDAVLETCEEYNVDPDHVEPLINRSVREKLQNDYVSLNYLKAESASII